MKADQTNIASLEPPAQRGLQRIQKSTCSGLAGSVDPLLIRTIRQLNNIGIYDGATMNAVYGRRLARVEAAEQRRVALIWARAA